VPFGGTKATGFGGAADAAAVQGQSLDNYVGYA